MEKKDIAFFKKIEMIDKNIKLDIEQKQIILNNSQNCLVVAGAGCGKTTLITIKAKYLVDVLHVNEKDILVISFTNESVNDLKLKINKEYHLNIDIKTFHKLGLDIIGKNTQVKIVNNLENILNNYFLHDIYFTSNYLEYLEFLYIYIYNQKLNKINIDNSKKNYVNSLEELAIYKFLNLSGINFKYKIINFNQIISEFIFESNGQLIKIRYLNKKKRLKKYTIDLIKGTNILNKLYKELAKYHILNFENREEYNLNYNAFIQLCCSFINNYKVNYIDESEFFKLKKKYINNYRTSLFLNIIYKAYQYYNLENQKNKVIDFNDMINKSIEILNNDYLNYKYVIIDEFQDISKNRFKIIDILSKRKTKIIAFGDDWQAIFGFAGSDVNIFVNLKELLKNCELLFLTKTYRNSQELIDIAGKFIMKNPNQIKKQLCSDYTLKNPINLYFYDAKVNKAELVYSIIENIVKEKPNSKVLIIGRYKFEIKEIIDKKYFDIKNKKLVCLKNNVSITFLTAHASKGLTYDEVIILNANNDIYGFPSQVIDDYEISILKETEKFYFEEERRLFYVALTRTRNHNYILCSIDKPSYFILELLNEQNIKINNLTNQKIINNYFLCLNCGYFIKKQKDKKNICPRCHHKFNIK